MPKHEELESWCIKSVADRTSNDRTENERKKQKQYAYSSSGLRIQAKIRWNKQASEKEM